ncbi:MAG: hypothetical protein ABIP39_00135 [Polyangiaceae bacterium]
MGQIAMAVGTAVVAVAEALEGESESARADPAVASALAIKAAIARCFIRT